MVFSLADLVSREKGKSAPGLGSVGRGGKTNFLTNGREGMEERLGLGVEVSWGKETGDRDQNPTQGNLPEVE